MNWLTVDVGPVVGLVGVGDKEVLVLPSWRFGGPGVLLLRSATGRVKSQVFEGEVDELLR